MQHAAARDKGNKAAVRTPGESIDAMKRLGIDSDGRSVFYVEQTDGILGGNHLVTAIGKMVNNLEATYMGPIRTARIGTDCRPASCFGVILPAWVIFARRRPAATVLLCIDLRKSGRLLERSEGP
jgi:hypothetical protein